MLLEFLVIFLEKGKNENFMGSSTLSIRINL